MKKPTNDQIAELLERIADFIEVEGANPFRIQAYRDGANTIRFLDKPAANLIQTDR